MTEVLSEQVGSEVIIDDKEHDLSLKETLKHIEDSGVKLNPEKCEYNMVELEYSASALDI